MKNTSKAILSLILIMALAPASITLKKAPADISPTEIQKNSKSISPETLTFLDSGSGRQITRSTKSLVYSLTGAAIDDNFTPDEVKALSIAFHTQLCHDNSVHSLTIDTADSTVFLSHEALSSKFGNNYTTMRSFCDNVYDTLILQSDKPAQLNLRFTSSPRETTDSPFSAANPFSSLFNGNIHFSSDCLTPEAAKLMSLQGNTYSEILYCFCNVC